MDPAYAGYGSREVADGNLLGAVRDAYNAALKTIEGRDPVFVEVVVRVAKKGD